jgi:hypothetical protein
VTSSVSICRLGDYFICTILGECTPCPIQFEENLSVDASSTSTWGSTSDFHSRARSLDEGMERCLEPHPDPYCEGSLTGIATFNETAPGYHLLERFA